MFCSSQGSKFGQNGGMGSVKDRMAFFKKAAEDEKKAKEKQFVQKTPSPTAPVNRFNATTPTSPAGLTSPAGVTSPTSPSERVSLKKAPDPNKA